MEYQKGPDSRERVIAIDKMPKVWKYEEAGTHAITNSLLTFNFEISKIWKKTPREFLFSYSNKSRSTIRMSILL